MKKFLFLILNFCFVAAMGQNLIRPITISVPPNPRANTADWATAMPPIVIMAQTKMDSGRISAIVAESKILVTIKGGGAGICGSYNEQTAPQSNFNSATKTWSGATINTLLGKDCILKPGSYELCVQFYTLGPTGNMLIGEACKSFTIADTKQQSYSPPQNILPASNKEFTNQEIKAPLSFRWNPVLPMPKEKVMYRLKVWQLMQGQNATQAMKSNQPVVTKDVDNITQAIITNLNGEPCMYPRPCIYVWNVEASKTSALGDIEMLGTSEATTFSVKSGDENPVKFTPPVNQSPVDGKILTKEEVNQPLNFRWKPVEPRPKQDVVYKVRIVEILKGQTAAQALKANKPIDVLEVKNEPQINYKLAQRTNGLSYAWNVEASKKSTMGDIEMLGTSDATALHREVDGKGRPASIVYGGQIDRQTVEQKDSDNAKGWDGKVQGRNKNNSKALPIENTTTGNPNIHVGNGGSAKGQVFPYTCTCCQKTVEFTSGSGAAEHKQSCCPPTPAPTTTVGKLIAGFCPPPCDWDTLVPGAPEFRYGGFVISNGNFNGKKILMSGDEINKQIKEKIKFGSNPVFKGALIKDIDQSQYLAAVYKDEIAESIDIVLIPLVNERGYLKMQGAAIILSRFGSKQFVSNSVSVSSKKHDYVGHVTLLR